MAGTDWLPPQSGVLAINAGLGAPGGMAIDASGAVYVADQVDHVVERISATGVLTIVAGNGKAGFSGDGGAATSASLNVPAAVAVDSAGNVYIADSQNNRIRRVSGGIITTIAGTGVEGFSGDGFPAVNAELGDPRGVATDTAGNIYIADSHNQRIRKITAGNITTVAGNGTYGYNGDNMPATNAELAFPYAVAVDASGNLYIADLDNNRIREVANGVITTVAGNGQEGYSGNGGAATSAELSGPWSVAVDTAGNIYIADTGNLVIREISGGIISTVAGDGVNNALGDGGPATKASIDVVEGVAAGANGVFYLSQYYEGRVRMVSQGKISTIGGNGDGGFAGDSGFAVNALLTTPQSLAFDPAGNLYIADPLNNRVRKVSGGIITTVAGNGAAGFSGDGGPAASASLFEPTGVAADAAGNLYIADTGNSRIRKVSGGIISTVVGNGSPGYSGDGGAATSATLRSPTSITFDSAGNLYIADYFNHRVREVSNGIITTVAGNGVDGFSGDGGPAASASLSYPTDAAVDSAGNLYIADSGNNRIRKVSNGNITTVAGNGTAGFAGDGGAAASAQLKDPTCVAVGAGGALYICDSQNYRVREVSGGSIATVAGNGAYGFSGDGGSPTGASLTYPEGLALDSAFDLYIADSNNHRVREVLAAPTAPQVTPSSLSFTAASGGSSPAFQTLTVSSAISGIPFKAVAASTGNWLSVNPTSGNLPALLQVSVNPAALSAGTYQGSVLIVSSIGIQAFGSEIPVSFTVQPAAPAALGVSTNSLTFSTTQGSGAISQSLQVLDTGGASLTFTATLASGSSWLSISSPSGSATPGNPAQLTVTATPGSLPAGTYSGALTIAGAGSSTNIPITFSISPPAGTIVVSQSALTFYAAAGGGAPLPGTFGILNSGQGSLAWSASAATLSGGPWLSIAPATGTVQQPYVSVSIVTASINPAGLSAGTYYGSIQISSAGALNSPQSLTVILNVLPAGTNLGPQIYPNGLIFTGVAGSDPGSQTVMVQNFAAGSNSYQSSTIGPLSILPANSAIQGSQPTTVNVYPDFSALGAGITRGTITLQFSDGSQSQAINVLMSAAPPAASDFTSKLDPRSTACPPQALNVIFRQPQASQSFTATVGQSITLEAQVSDACGNLVSPASGSPQVLALFSNGDPQATMSYLGNGVWQASWRPVNAAALAVVTVDALMVSGQTVVGGQSTVRGAVVPPAANGATPLVTAQGVVHAASDLGAIPIAPGELITVYGSNLATGPSANSNLPLPLSSNGTQIFLGTQPLPILYTSSGQMNVQVPYSAPVNTTYQLSVQNGSTLSVPQTLTVAQASPGIFTTNEQGAGQGAIVKSDGVTLAQPGTPASIGEVIVIYCTGLGATTPAVKEGQAAPSDPALAATTNPVSVNIGGQPAQVLFSGLTPGYAGLYQVNAIVPSGIATGDAVPVTLTVAGQTSQTGVTISVH